MARTELDNRIAALGVLPLTSFATGAWLVATGIRRGTLAGGLLAAGGGALLYRSVVRRAPDASDRRPLFARGLMVKRSVRVARSPEECYRFWRNLETLGSFMDHLHSVRVLSGTRSRWIAKLAGGASIEWDAEIVKDVPGQIIGWRALPGSPLQTAGSVRFEPDGEGTIVVVTFKFDPPAGKLGAAIAGLLGDEPSKSIEEDLERFRKIIEKSSFREQNTIEAETDPVDRASEESFPASDPPSWTPAKAT